MPKNPKKNAKAQPKIEVVEILPLISMEEEQVLLAVEDFEAPPLEQDMDFDELQKIVDSL